MDELCVEPTSTFAYGPLGIPSCLVGYSVIDSVVVLLAFLLLSSPPNFWKPLVVAVDSTVVVNRVAKTHNNNQVMAVNSII